MFISVCSDRGRYYTNAPSIHLLFIHLFNITSCQTKGYGKRRHALSWSSCLNALGTPNLRGNSTCHNATLRESKRSLRGVEEMPRRDRQNKLLNAFIPDVGVP